MMQLNSCRWLSICISPHLDAIAKALSHYFEDFQFLYTEEPGEMRKKVGWNADIPYEAKQYQKDDVQLCVEADLYIDHLRRLDLLEARAKSGKLSVYMGERWFKPPIGFIRVFVPSYRKMAKRFAAIFNSGNLLLFPSGVHAVRDMLRLFQFLKGDLRALFRAPEVAFESRPGGRIYLLKDAYRVGLLSLDEYNLGKKIGFVQIPHAKWNGEAYSAAIENIFLGGYIVESKLPPSTMLRLSTIRQGTKVRPFRILWAGRMLDWKRVNVLITAVRQLVDQGFHISLLIVGEGPEREKLLTCAKEYKHVLVDNSYHAINDETCGNWESLFEDRKIYFSPYLKNTIIQRLMRETIDLYIMPSDGGEGWGAVVSEAVLANCPALSTFEAGSSATLLPKDLLYPAKSVKGLSEKLKETSFYVPGRVAATWTGENYAKALIDLIK